MMSHPATAAVAGRQVESAATLLVAVAALAVLGYRLGSSEPAASAVAAAAAVLVVAVPGALRLATGLPRLVGTDRAGRLGVLVSTAAFDTARRVATVVFAGTGTLTRGGLAVHAVHAVDGAAPAEVLRLAGSVARESDHPLDRAVAAAVEQAPDAGEFDTVAGLGLRGLVAEVVGAPDEEQRVIAHAVLVGDPGLLAVHDIEPPARSPEPGCVPVAVAWDGVARGLLEVGPAVRTETAAAVQELTALGLQPVLVTSESAAMSRAVAARAGIPPDSVLAGVDPDDAAAAVRELPAPVAVIGAPEPFGAALDAADLAVRLPPHPAAGHGPPRPALTLVHDDLSAVVRTIRLARHTVAVGRANLIVWTASVAALLPLTTVGLLGPVHAAAATAACGAVIAVNSLRPQRRTATDG
ncbi:HAD family hydrolase [Pseudonocardia zijingensis]|uniref:Uncharacterized protein n=1 Tax=Pseudonocardia zijingensis TaxID=153376 RepID=A0ABN1N9U2_9PSEU